MTLQKLTNQEFEGIDPYIPKAMTPRRLTLSQSEDRHERSDEVLAEVFSVINHPKYQRAVRVVLDELLTNAFYHAPVNENGQRLYSHLDRTIPIQLPREKSIELSYGYQQDQVWISVKDHYGSFSPEKFMQSLRQYFRNHQKIIPRHDQTGAGVGLSVIYRHVSQWCINILPAVYSEMIVGWDLSVEYSDFLKTQRNLNLFVNRKEIL